MSLTSLNLNLSLLLALRAVQYREMYVRCALCSVLLWSVIDHFAHIFQGYFIGSGAIATVPVKQRWVIWINSLWPNHAIWRHRSRSTLAQVMACCLTAPSHYLNQCWLIFSKVQWHSVEGNLTRDSSPFNHENKLENYLSKILFKSPRGQWVNRMDTGGTDHII